MFYNQETKRFSSCSKLCNVKFHAPFSLVSLSATKIVPGSGSKAEWVSWSGYPGPQREKNRINKTGSPISLNCKLGSAIYCCVALDKYFLFSGPHFPHMLHKHKKIYLVYDSLLCDSLLIYNLQIPV